MDRWRWLGILTLLGGALAGLAAPGALARGRSTNQQPRERAIQVRPSPQLFATLCAVYAAGYPNVPADTPSGLRDIILHLVTAKGPSVAALRKFYDEHRLATPQETLSQYVSFAMVVGPPPDFEFLVPTEGLPPDVRNLGGFRKLLVTFYASQDLNATWQRVRPYYQAEAAQLRGPVSGVVRVATAFTRRMGRFQGFRTFTVNVDPLIGSMTNFRIYSGRYEIAVNPAVPGVVTDIRHAFLHFLLDPLPFDDRADVDAKRYLLFYATKAPRLPRLYKYDFVSYTDECLVRAVQLHLRHLSAGERDALLDRDDRDGYLLVRPLYFGLDSYLRSPKTLAAYFPMLMQSIDVKTEAAREARIVFAPARSTPATPAETAADHAERWLNLGDEQIATGNAKGAAASFERVLKVDPKNPGALYGLAVSSAINGQAERAHQLFTEIIQPPVSNYADPSILSWSHVYLGRMNDVMGRRSRAIKEYRAALAVAGLPDGARTAAEKGVKHPYHPAGAGPGSAPHR